MMIYRNWWWLWVFLRGWWSRVYSSCLLFLLFSLNQQSHPTFEGEDDFRMTQGKLWHKIVYLALSSLLVLLFCDVVTTQAPPFHVTISELSSWWSCPCSETRKIMPWWWQHLQIFCYLSIHQSASFVKTCCQKFIQIWSRF